MSGVVVVVASRNPYGLLKRAKRSSAQGPRHVS